MKIRIWGARGSIPSPIKPDAIEEKITQAILQMPPIDTTDEEMVKAYVQSLPVLLRGTAGGNTACVEIDAGDEIFIMDAGSGIRELGLELMKGPCGRGEGVIHLFFSHPHWDHIQGFPFFVPAFIPGNKIYFYSIHDVRSALADQQRPLTFPVSVDYMRADREFIQVEVGKPFTLGPLRINTIPNAHPGVAYSYRFEDKHSTFIFASDAEYKNLDSASIQPYLEFFKDADLLLFDAQYTLKEAWQKVDWGHSSAMIGADLARAAGVKRLLLFHHDPTYSDADLVQIQKTAEAYQAQDSTRTACEIIVAYEGFSIDLTPPGIVDIHMVADTEAAVLTPSNMFSQQSVHQLEQKLEELSGTHSTPIIDLSHIETLSVAGLKSLLNLHQKKGNTQIVLANPSHGTREIIKLSGYQSVFAIYPSIESALLAVQTREALDLPGQLINNRYRIEQKMGDSPLGIAVKATDMQTGAKVLLKILSPFLNPDTTKKFMQMARSMMSLAHPNITRVLDCIQTEKYTFFVEAFETGTPLQSLLDDDSTRLDTVHIIQIIHQIMNALAYAHSTHIVHGDLKPQNIFISDDRVRVSGFGLGRLDEGRNLFDAPRLLLTPSYLAPEQINGMPIDARTDLYALGVIMYRLFTGCLPFTGTDSEIMQSHLKQMPVPSHTLNPNLSPVLEHIIQKLLAKDPEARYQSVTDVLGVMDSINIHFQHPFPMPQITVQKKATFNKLVAWWKKTPSSGGQFAIIDGLAGSGKSTLVEHFAEKIAHPLFFWGEVNAQSLMPYAPFAKILNQYIADHNLSPTAILEQYPAILPIFPEWQSTERQLSPSPTPKMAQQFLETCIDLFATASRKTPWVIVLENIHYADRATLDLLYHLLLHREKLQIFFIVTVDSTHFSDDHPAKKFFDRLANAAIIPHRLHLKGISRAHTRQILAGIWGNDIPEKWIKTLQKHSNGNPLFIEELARALTDDGKVFWHEQAWQFSDINNVRLPNTARETIWRRLHHLNPDTQTLLRQSAVWGRRFRLDDLQTVSGLSTDEILSQLDDALAGNLVFETAEPGTFAHRHSEVRQVLYADIGAARRHLLHRQIAAVLERENGSPRKVPLLAHHYKEADLPEKAVPYAIRAAEQAVSMIAPKLALQWYNEALAMLTNLSPQTMPEYQIYQNTIHRALGQVLTLFQDFDDTVERLADISSKKSA